MDKKVWQDERVIRYQREGHFGYAHAHERTPQSDATLAQAVKELRYTHEEQVGLLISREGRWAAEMLGAWALDDAQDDLRRFLSARRTRRSCKDVARNERNPVAR